MTIIDTKDFLNIIPNWAKGINDFLIDESTFKVPTSLKPIFYTGYGIDNQEFVATRILDGFTKPNPSKRYIISCIKDLEINPIKEYCKNNNLIMTYKILPFHHYFFGDIKIIQYRIKEKKSLVERIKGLFKKKIDYRQ